jgi:hypothetical protein
MAPVSSDTLIEALGDDILFGGPYILNNLVIKCFPSIDWLMAHERKKWGNGPAPAKFVTANPLQTGTGTGGLISDTDVLSPKCT